ncbi:MAG: aminoacylase [Paenibacillaceae bacterium]|jgi:N-acyl-D-amino-acid deacylase|nr:aminoacylase [Paenibacillaceae bacterium]
MSLDILFRNGRIVDGSGNDSYVGDVAVEGEKIAAVGKLEGASAALEIDISGRCITPGFIDVHNHFELGAVIREDRSVLIEQGITTIFAGSDGFSWAPLSGKRLSEMQEYLSPFYGTTPADWGGASIREFLDKLTGKIPVNYVNQVPHGAIRLAVMGWDARPANGEDIRAMSRLTEEWMEAGSVAFNTGLDYEPQGRANTDELIALSKVTARRGGLYAAHQRGYGERLEQGLKETFEIARRAQIPVHISHMRIDEFGESLLDRADREGIDYSFDLYPFRASSTQLLYYLPKWAKEGPPERLMKLLQDPQACAEFRSEIGKNYGDYNAVLLSTVDCDKYRQFQGKSAAEAAALTGMAPEELIMNLLRETNLRAMAIYRWPAAMAPELHRTFRHPRHMVGSDGFLLDGHPHPRGYGSYPYVLETLVREESCISLETAVYKMSGFPAQRFGLKGRGLLQAGCAADLLVFDLDKVHCGADYQNPTQPPSGMEQVMIHGQFALKDGRYLDQRLGRVL